LEAAGNPVSFPIVSEAEILKYVGVTGLPGSGKGAFIAELDRQLVEANVYLHYWSLSDELREEARRRGEPISRPALRRIANELRKKEGAGVLAIRVSAKAQQMAEDSAGQGKIVVVVDAIRNPEEVRALQRALAPAFTLVAVEAPMEQLVARIAARARADETAEVVGQEAKARQMILGEAGEGEPAHGHNIKACMAMADHHLDNSGSLADLAAETSRFVESLLSRAETSG